MTIVAPGDVQAVEIDRPRILEPGDAIVRVTTAAISTRDLERYAGRRSFPTVTPGGACAGIVEETGGGVARCQLDDPVLVPPALLVGGASLLPGFDLPGSHAGWIRVPDADQNLIPVPNPRELEAGAVMIADCYAAAHALARRLKEENVRRVVVLGCGPSSLAFIIAWNLQAAKAAKPLAIDSVPGRVMLARRLGASGFVYRPDGSLSERMADALDPPPEAIVVGPKSEGADADWMPTPGTRGLPVYALDAPGFGWTADHDALEAPRTSPLPTSSGLADHVMTLQKGRLDLLPLVSHTLPLTEAAAAYEWAFRGTNGALRILLKA